MAVKPSDRIKIAHDKTKQTAEVTRRQFDSVWKARGWKIDTSGQGS